jgi:hypothetical protein
MKATRDHLFGANAPKVGNGTVDVDGLEFEIRPLSRYQQLEVQEAREKHGIAAADALLCSYGLVDPALTPEEVTQWQLEESQGPTLSALSQGIGQISGMLPDSGKAAYKSPRRRPRA